MLDSAAVAGTFEALRIVRRAQLVDKPDYLTSAQVFWYAPALGADVRQLVGETLVELVSSQRGPE